MGAKGGYRRNKSSAYEEGKLREDERGEADQET